MNHDDRTTIPPGLSAMIERISRPLATRSQVGSVPRATGRPCVDSLGLTSEIARRIDGHERNNPADAEKRVLIEMIRLGAAFVALHGIHWRGFLALELHAAELEDQLNGLPRNLSIKVGAPLVAFLVAVEAKRRTGLSENKARLKFIDEIRSRLPAGTRFGTFFPDKAAKVGVQSGDKLKWQEHSPRIARLLKNYKDRPEAWGPSSKQLYDRLMRMLNGETNPQSAYAALLEFAVSQVRLAGRKD